MTRDQVIAVLIGSGAGRDRAVMYADAYQEYVKASGNLDEYGLIISHPRTGAPVPNPYLVIRDRALKKLRGMRDVDASALWAVDVG
jgi:hypothetical protein